jgi:hypothetical protein
MAQVFGFILVSLGYMFYIVSVMPFEELSLNYLEVFNECIILGCLYHLLVFTGGLTDDVHKVYIVGWSMDVVLLFQFAVNVLFMAYGYILKIRDYYRRFRLRKYHQEMRRARKKYEES